MKFSKMLCMALAATTIISFSTISAFVSSANHDVSTVEKGFIPSDNSTWGDLYRYFDPKGFSALSPKTKHLYDSTLLNNSTTSSTLANTTTANSATAFMEEHGKTDCISISGTIQPIENE